MNTNVCAKENSFVGEDGKTYVVTYKIISMPYKNTDIFGFEILKQLACNEDLYPVESETAQNITDCLDTANAIFKRLFDYQVTPVSLNYIIDDFIGELTM